MRPKNLIQRNEGLGRKPLELKSITDLSGLRKEILLKKV